MSEDQPTLESAQPGPPEPGGLPIGTRVGRYLLLQRLASGGMGDVYAAYDPHLDRKVALKILRAELTSAPAQVEWRGRLLREAHALARLSHPNVVTIHDAGLWEGELFLAMELVDGYTLRSYIEEGPHPWREVLPLLLAAGRGLAAAHEAGLVHRDFKPSNVLIARSGRVCVVDFGLARPAAQGGGSPEGGPSLPPGSAGAGPAHLAVTQDGRAPGTPGYMSPEQCHGEPVDARSDQFSFAVTLFEALSGARPFQATTFHAYAEEVARGLSALPLPEDRAPGWVRRALLRALALYPPDRYPSMAALLADLESDPPARRRRRLLRAGAVALGLGAAAAAGAAALSRPRPCEGGPERLGAAWDDRRRESVRASFGASGAPYAAQSAGAVVEALDEYGRAWAAMYLDACQATRVRGEQSEELLDLRMDCLGDRLDSVAALVRVLERADEEIVTNAPGAVAGLEPLEACADARALLEGERRPSTPEARAAMELSRQRHAEARALHDAGKFGQALGPSREAAEAAGRSGSPLLESEALVTLAMVQLRGADYTAALETAHRASRAAQASGDARAQTRAWALLARIVGLRLERFDEAHVWTSYAEVAAARAGSRRLQAEHQHLLAQLYSRQARYPEAVAAAEAALGHAEADGLRQEAVAQILTTLAWNEGYLGRREEALHHLERAYAALSDRLGKDHPNVLRTRVSQAMALWDVGRLEPAIAELEDTLRAAERAYAAGHPTVAAIQSNLAELYVQAGRAREGTALAERALAFMEKKLGKEHRRLAPFADTLAGCLLEEGRPAEALAWSRRAVALQGEDPAGKDLNLAGYLVGLGRARLAVGQATAAVEALERAARALEGGGALPEDVAEAQDWLARALWQAGKDRRRAVELAEAARAGYAAGGPRSRRRLVELEAWLGPRRPR